MSLKIRASLWRIPKNTKVVRWIRGSVDFVTDNPNFPDPMSKIVKLDLSAIVAFSERDLTLLEYKVIVGSTSSHQETYTTPIKFGIKVLGSQEDIDHLRLYIDGSDGYSYRGTLRNYRLLSDDTPLDIL